MLVRKRKCIPNTYEEEVYTQQSGINKSFGQNIFNRVADDSWQTQLLNAMARGEDEGCRIGSRIEMKQLLLNTSIQANTVTGEAGLCRIMIVYDRQPNCLDIDFNVLFGWGGNIYSFVVPSAKYRYNILLDETLAYPSAVTGDKSGIWNVPYIRDLRFDLPAIYNEEDTGQIYDINTGSLYFICIGTQGWNGANKYGYITGNFELKYKDV